MMSTNQGNVMAKNKKSPESQCIRRQEDQSHVNNEYMTKTKPVTTIPISPFDRTESAIIDHHSKSQINSVRDLLGACKPSNKQHNAPDIKNATPISNELK